MVHQNKESIGFLVNQMEQICRAKGMAVDMEQYYFTTQKMCVGYDGRPLIKDVEIALEQGEFLTLIGPNGAGKSTVLTSIAGQLRLLGGSVCLGENVLSEMKRNELARKMSVVFTQKVRAELKTCRDVAATGRYPYTGRFGVLSKEDWRLVDEVLELTRTANIAGQDFDTVSDGQKHRVMLARAICQEPEILVLDEPTSYLDIRYKLEFLAILEEMRDKKNLTVVMSLHELELAKMISDQILCLKGAYVERYGTPEEIFEGDFIRELYGIDDGIFSGDKKFQAYIRQIGQI